MKSHQNINKKYQSKFLEQREIDLILCHVLNVNTAGLFIYDKDITPDQHEQIINICKQREEGIPFAYITGQKAFWKLDLKVNKHTLIPRPETELLVEMVLSKTDKMFSGNILDLGTGTGAIALSIAQERPHANITAIDFSSECIKVAEFNKTQNKVANVNFIQSHWFEKIGPNTFDIIVSNPPYIDENDSHLKSLKHEPISALTAKNKGYADLFHIIENAKYFMNNGGTLMLEHGYDQSQTIQQYLHENCYKNVKSENDLAGIPRITMAEF